jgi:hypothetical protein
MAGRQRNASAHFVDPPPTSYSATTRSQPAERAGVSGDRWSGTTGRGIISSEPHEFQLRNPGRAPRIREFRLRAVPYPFTVLVSPGAPDDTRP